MNIKTLSSTQKGVVAVNRASEIIILSSNGKLTCYTPIADDDGIDLIINSKGSYKPIFLQVKSCFKLQKSGAFVQDVGVKTFRANKSFFILFIYFNIKTLEIDTLWLIPSFKFKHILKGEKIRYEEKINL